MAWTPTPRSSSPGCRAATAATTSSCACRCGRRRVGLQCRHTASVVNIEPTKDKSLCSIKVAGVEAATSAQKLGQLQPFAAVFLQECTGQLPSCGPTYRLSRPRPCGRTARGATASASSCRSPAAWTACTGLGRTVATLSPLCRHFVAALSPHRRHFVATLSPLCRHFVATSSPLCRHFVSHLIPDSLRYSVPLFLKRRCDRTPGVHPVAEELSWVAFEHGTFHTDDGTLFMTGPLSDAGLSSLSRPIFGTICSCHILAPYGNSCRRTKWKC